jgi:hypothetical protein
METSQIIGAAGRRSASGCRIVAGATESRPLHRVGQLGGASADLRVTQAFEVRLAILKPELVPFNIAAGVRFLYRHWLDGPCGVANLEVSCQLVALNRPDFDGDASVDIEISGQGDWRLRRRKANSLSCKFFDARV